ncbi:unnamed protein product [Allacma fusca]|uniref:PHD-type domain-containing protein n=1 Tax=Allacma fusca TaxID=39272 RepID=A0A8J2K739_9HEXA|nr:unnamed protein product [Allacma fusca]
MVKRIETRWKNLQPDGIAAAMTGISQRAERWLSDRSDKSTSLWVALAQSLWPRRRIDKRDRTWLRIIFVDNRRNVQGLFRERVDFVLFEPVTPLAKSTPRPKQQKYCVFQKRYNASEDSLIECNGCQEWYHAICINIDFSSAAADSSWRCPRCLGLPQARFPDGWEESIQQPRQPLSISSIPLTLNQGKSIQETGFETRLVDVTSKGHVIEVTTTDYVSSFTEVENHSNFEPEQMYVEVSDSSSDDRIPRTSGLRTAIVISRSEDDSISHPCSPRRSCSPTSEEGAIQHAGCTRTSLLQTIWLDESDEDGQEFQTQILQQSRKRKQPSHDASIPKRT